MENNCSGRFSMKETTLELLKKSILEYNPKNGYDMRKIAEEEFDMLKQCKKYLKLIK